MLLLVNAHGNSNTANKLKTARNIKIQGAVSGNASFDGSNDVTINVTQANIAIIKGTIQMPEAGSEAINGGTKVNYPQGYTSENCVVVSLMSHNTLHSDHWCTTGQVDALSIMQGNGNLFARLTPESITISVEKLSTGEQRRDVTFRLVLMKVL